MYSYHGNPINQQAPTYPTMNAPKYNTAQNNTNYNKQSTLKVASVAPPINPEVLMAINPVENKDFNRKQSLKEDTLPQVPMNAPAVPSSWLNAPYDYVGYTGESSYSDSAYESEQDDSNTESADDASVDEESDENVSSDPSEDESIPEESESS